MKKLKYLKKPNNPRLKRMLTHKKDFLFFYHYYHESLSLQDNQTVDKNIKDKNL